MSTQLHVFHEHGDSIVGLAALGHETSDLVDGMDHGGVVAPTKESGNCWIRQIGEFAENVHGFLASHHEWTLATLSPERIDSEAQHAGDFGEQLLVGPMFGGCAWQ